MYFIALCKLMRYTMFMIRNIIEEMYNGNFSFLILVVGFLQLVLMYKNYRENKKK